MTIMRGVRRRETWRTLKFLMFLLCMKEREEGLLTNSNTTNYNWSIKIENRFSSFLLSLYSFRFRYSISFVKRHRLLATTMFNQCVVLLLLENPLSYNLEPEWRRELVITSEQAKRLMYDERPSLGLDDFLNCTLGPLQPKHRLFHCLQNKEMIPVETPIIVLYPISWNFW